LSSSSPKHEHAGGELVGLAEVAELLGVTKRTATSYSNRDDFPAPLQRLKAGPVWRRRDVTAWKAVTLPLTQGRPKTAPTD